jgi:energy-coupling factor transporter ATP-binding protein EcfA2
MQTQNMSTQINTKTIQSPYDYYQIYQLVVSEGKSIYGNEFKIDDIDRPVVMKLITYFLQDISVAVDQEIDLYKGLLISGPAGCGKTAIMRILSALLPPNRGFITRSCYGVILDYMDDGHETVKLYTSGSFELYSDKPKTFYFDDLGLEPDANHFGNLRNVMADILLLRYDFFMKNHMLTFLTTNLDSDELEERYGSRIRSRIRQMCQLIAFSPDSKDKRK